MSEIVRITPTQLENLFHILKFDPKTRKWKRKTEASKKLGLSRPTIDKILKLYPEGMPKKPKKTLPKYFEEFEQTETAKKVKEFYWDRKLNRLSETGEHVYATLREAWKIRSKKDPIDFNLEDFLVFWGTSTQAPHPDFVDPQTGKIAFPKAVHLRFAMKMNPDPDIKALVDDPRFITKGLKREAGRKKHMYLETPDILKVCNAINEPDTLMLSYLGILIGGRFSALRGLRVQHIHRQGLYLDLYEPKVEKTVEKDLFDFALNFLWAYITDFNRTNYLFLESIDTYNDRLSKAGQEAGIPFPLTTHILKHTCVTQMSLHGVDMDVVSDYVGTDPKTLMLFYRGGGKEKVRAQILDLPRTQKTWKQFVSEVTPYFIARYNHLKPFFKPVDKIQRV